jgi:hypothetical protein
MLFTSEVKPVFEQLLNRVFGDVEGLLEGFYLMDEVTVLLLDVLGQVPRLDVLERVKGDDHVSERGVFL